ncbi:MurR/RpiR family transcriptional regulator [Alkalihalobacillus pseudalcaliphilus]|uniref:MurR/RpiR family transcriptional regulator n=1 Tax=Alkalihalobacillus pseudalcaliphilus TaxID=79884 RepID=UPI00064DAB97|nr:MurR/RpiR family transcriptional regulator [Alkalihalobacillus pseudalcaliphilus]KMK75132.1 RpiR family transcriptional regulator [Alkalihalobacillus pseudalcaliphilus]
MSHMKGGLVILKDTLSGLPPSEQRLAQFIIKNPEESILMTAMTLGEKSETSSAAVIRLCKSLGFSGFQELKLRIAGDLQVDSVEGNRDIERDEDFRNIVSKVNANTLQTLKETVDIMKFEQLEEAVRVLIHAKSIIFVGFGASNLAAQDAEQKFMRINKQVNSYSDVHVAATAIANKGPEDVIVGISFSGNTQEVTKLLEIAKENHCQTISISKYGNSSITNLADINLYITAGNESTFRSGATASRIAQLHMIDILFMCYASKEYDETIQFLDRTRKTLDSFKGKRKKGV